MSQKNDQVAELLNELDRGTPQLFADFSQHTQDICRKIYESCLQDSSRSEGMFERRAEVDQYLIGTTISEIYNNLKDCRPYHAQKTGSGMIQMKMSGDNCVVARWVCDPRSVELRLELDWGYCSDFIEELFSEQERLIILQSVNAFLLSESMHLEEFRFSRKIEEGEAEISWDENGVEMLEGQVNPDNYFFHHRDSFHALSERVGTCALASVDCMPGMFGYPQSRILTGVDCALEGLWMKLLSEIPPRRFKQGRGVLHLFEDDGGMLRGSWCESGQGNEIDMPLSVCLALDLTGCFNTSEIELLSRIVCDMLGSGSLILPGFSLSDTEASSGQFFEWCSLGDAPGVPYYCMEERSLYAWRLTEKIYELWLTYDKRACPPSEHSRNEAIDFISSVNAGFYLSLMEELTSQSITVGRGDLMIEGVSAMEATIRWSDVDDRKRLILDTFSQEAQFLASQDKSEIDILCRILSEQFFEGSLHISDLFDFRVIDDNVRAYSWIEDGERN